MTFTLSLSSSPLLNRNPFFSPFFFTTLAFIFLVIFFYPRKDDIDTIFRLIDYAQRSKLLFGENNNKEKLLLPPFAVGEGERDCDVFAGKWVPDRENRPLYEEEECPYLIEQVTCQHHGRPDKDYLYWRWQPHSCSLPRFNATLMLESLRGKRMMFVGDSLNGGQYLSLVCLLQKVIPKHAKSMQGNVQRKVFTAKDYNATIEFYFAPVLMEASDSIVRNDSINTHGDNWKGVDIIIFNTYVWWMKGASIKVLRKGSFDDQQHQDIVDLSSEEAYRMAMQSMLGWVEKNMDPKKTRVFFSTMSPFHSKSIEWGGEKHGSCYNETKPIEDQNFWSTSTSKRIMQVIREVFSETKVPITLLNITQLSSYRKDAHSSIYKKQWYPLSKEELLANPLKYADCVHWCLPGLQDTWNELLFTKLFYP